MRKVWKKIIRVFLALILIMNSFMVSTFKTEAATITTSSIDVVCKKYGYAKGKYWTYFKASDKDKYTASSKKGGTGYRYAKGEQCYAFAMFLMEQVTGKKVGEGKWKTLSVASTTSLQVGDIVRTDCHTSVVYKDLGGGKYEFIEAWGGVNNYINIGKFSQARKDKNDNWYFQYASTLTQLKSIGLNKIYRYGGTVSSAPSTLSISGASLPSTINKGSYFDCKGTISSNYSITNVTGKILKPDGTTVMYEKYVTPNSTSYSLSGGAIDTALKFNLLPAGTYYYKVWASDTKATGKNMINKQFTVVDSNDSKITISNAKVTAINDGVITFEFDANATAGIKDVKCSAWPADWGGSTYKWIDTPSSVSGNHYTFKIDNKLWDYHTATYKIHAHVWDKTGKKVNTANPIECVVAASNLKIDNASTISDFYRGEDVDFQGIISSNYNLKNVTARIYKEDGVTVASEATVYPSNTKSYNLSNSDVIKALQFNELDSGKYIYKLWTTDVTGNNKLLSEQPFKVNARAVAVIIPSQIAIKPSTLELKVGESYKLQADVSPCSEETKYTWYCYSLGVASVDSNGVVTAEGVGEASVGLLTLNPSGITSCKVVVTEVPLESIAIKDAPEMMNIGDTAQLSVDVTPSNASNTKIIWTSSDSNIADVDDTGKVVASQAGSVVITASSEDGSIGQSVGIIVKDNTVTQTIDYTVVPELKVGTNKITEDNKLVTYKDDMKNSAGWSGQVFKYSVPAEGKNTVKVTCKSDDTYSMDIYEYATDKTMRYQNSMYTSNGVFTYSLDQSKEYYLVFNGYDSDYSMYTKAQDMQDVTIEILDDVPKMINLLDNAETILPNNSYNVAASNLQEMFISDWQGVRTSKLYKIDLPADYEVAIDAIGADQYVLDCYTHTDDYMIQDGLNDGIGGKYVLRNYNGETTTYYIVAFQGNITLKVGALQQQEIAENLLDADITELNPGVDTVINASMQKNLSYDLFGQTKKTSGVWMKFTVPEGGTYLIEDLYNGAKDETNLIANLLRYDPETDEFESFGENVIEYCFKDQKEMINTFPQGEYYICLSGNSEDFPLTMCTTILRGIDEIKDQALTITDEDIKNGIKNFSCLKDMYGYYTSYDHDRWGSYGQLLKVSIPENSSYSFVANNNLHIYVYEDDCKTTVSYGPNITNTSNTRKDYYIWVSSYSYDSDLSLRIDSAEACTHENTEVQNEIYNTCTDDGYTGDTFCKNCGILIQRGTVVNKTGHESSDWIIDVDASEEDTGFMHKECLNCGEILESKEIPKTGEDTCSHESTEVRGAKEASCTEAGYTGDTYCVDCDTKLATGEVIAKKDHTSSDWIVDKAATVDAEGSRHKECTVCKTVLAKEAIAKLPAPTPTPEPVVIPDVTIRYTTHVQTFGWQGDENNASKWFVNGKMAGTSGKAKRLEGIKIRVYGNDNLGIQYTTHCQSYGWLPWSANGEMNGTEGEAKRLEAIKIQLTGADKDKYDVYYRVHAQSYGWLGWAKNGAPSGTAGYAKRLEGIQIVVVKKGAAVPGVNYAGVNAASGVHQAASYIAKSGSSPVVGNQATSNINPSVAGEANVNVAYRTHVQTYGWQGWKYNGQMSGTSGQAKRLEGINIKLTNKPYSGSIVYTTHVQTYGWQGNENNPNTWKRDGDMSGTSGEAKRLEAIRIALTGEMAEHYDVYYRVHAQSFGWLGWAKNGEAAGTAGLAKRLEGIQIVLVPKGGNAPARSYQGITSVKTQAYIKK